MNRSSRHDRIRAFVTAFLLALFALRASPSGAAPEATQVIALQPGWNAVFLEVQPEPRDPATVFSGIAVESVWTFTARDTVVEFIQDPGEGLWNTPGWLGFRPALPAALSNLHAIQANRAYLIKLGGGAPATWSVTGRPAAAPIRWVADSFNLVGLPVQDDGAVSFANFFAGSTAHAGRVFYRLGASGSWEFVENPATAYVRRGESCWVYCDGASAFQGPLVIDPPGDGLDYGAVLSELAFTVRNVTGTARQVTLEVLAPADSAPLVQKVYDETSGYFVWPGLPRTVTVNAGETRQLTLAVRRELLAGAPYEAVLRVGEDLGGSIGVKALLPVSAR